MEQQNKELLLRYLSMALPYGVVIKITSDDGMLDVSYNMKLDADLLADLLHGEDDFMPYLRSLSSMTEEEMDAYANTGSFLYANGIPYNLIYTTKGLLFLLNNHFDIFNLIPKGLAIEVTEENNPYK